MPTDSCHSCSAPCCYKEDDLPCWGQVSVIDDVEDYDGGCTWIHACPAHEGLWDGYGYKTSLFEEPVLV